MAKDGLHQIRIYGEPQPAPKKDVAVIQRPGQKPRLVPVDHDYRTRKNPNTGKIEKYDHGYKRRWIEHVRNNVLAWMAERKVEPFEKNHPIGLGIVVFRNKAETNKLPVPSLAPDEDNYSYAIRNALKRTPAISKLVKELNPSTGRIERRRVRVEGPHPKGVLYYEDDQIVMTLHPSAKIWATKDEPPGVLITFADFYDVHEQLGRFDPLKDFSKQEALL